MKYGIYTFERDPFFVIHKAPETGEELPAEFVAKYSRVMKEFEDMQDELKRIARLEDESPVTDLRRKGEAKA